MLCGMVYEKNRSPEITIVAGPLSSPLEIKPKVLVVQISRQPPVNAAFSGTTILSQHMIRRHRASRFMIAFRSLSDMDVRRFRWSADGSRIRDPVASHHRRKLKQSLYGMRERSVQLPEFALEVVGL